ncbi:MAG: class II aldolase/adducin family protein [Planctomycetota bacterium]
MLSEWKVKREICEIGRRVYARQFAAGNDGNISCRISDNIVVCTPTQICKGFMNADDLCTIDMEGKQLSGMRKPTSETQLHLEIYRGDPKVRAVVHCHPPHATAFGMAGEDIPTCILPEVEVFLGVVPRAGYETPGGQSFAEGVRPFVGRANTVVLSNHGTVSWGPTLERAYWHTEILDAYCRMLLLAKQVGGIHRLPEPKVDELLDLKERFGAGVDSRRKEGGDLCVNTQFARAAAPCRERCGVNTAPATTDGSNGTSGGAGHEELVRLIAERVMAALAQGAG